LLERYLHEMMHCRS